MYTGFPGASLGSAPSFCPRCGARTEITRYGTVAPHSVRGGGPSCDGAGLAPTGMAPWPGTIKPGPAVKRTRLRRLTRPGRAAARR